MVQNMFFKKKSDELKTDFFLSSHDKTESLSTEITLEKITSDKQAFPEEEEITFWDEKSLREQIGTDIYSKYKSLNEFAMECSVDRSLITQWIAMKKNISRDRLLCILITLYGEENDGATKINEMLKALKGIDGLHIHNARDYNILFGITHHKKLDEIDEMLRKKQLAGFENIQ